jgi:sensor histidine kinase YesM
LANSFLSNKSVKLVFAAWWLIWTMVHYNVLLNFGVSLIQALTDSAISSLLLAGCCLMISNNMRYYLPRQERYWYILVISVALSCLWLLLVRILLKIIFKDDSVYISLLNHSSAIRYGIAFLMVCCMAAISLLWYHQQDQKEIDKRKTDAEKMTRDAELYKLRQQLQPHFLFNSLNSISALTGNDPEKARHMIQQLSDFLRGTLRKDEQQWNSLEEELEYLQLYLDIEKVRFGHRLQTNVTYDDKVLQMKLPSMLLQPVVENAIKFGLYDTIGEVNISINAISSNGVLEVQVQNPFDETTAPSLPGTGFGLSSIQRRLFLLFARHDLLKTKTDNNHFITTILIPQIT